MKDYAWKIKVSDLLKNPGNTDNIKFENKFLKTNDITLSKEWIKWEVFLQWINHDEILVNVEKLSLNIIYNCDICWKEYKNPFELKDKEQAKFVNTDKIKIKEKIYDDNFPIDMRTQNIDIENLIEIIIKSQEPIIKKCWKCKSKKISEEEKNQEENLTYNIDFSKLLKS